MIRRKWARRAVIVILLGVCVAGAARLAEGAIIPVKAAVAQVLLKAAYRRSIADGQPAKPWPWADMAPAARLAVPQLGQSRIVLDAGSGQAMAFGPTRLPGGGRIGQRGTVVIAAHRDTHFRFLQNVVKGDVVTLRGLDDAQHRYRVTGTNVVRWNEFAISNRGGRQKLVLTTCYPFGGMTHGPLRYVVNAVAVNGTL